VLQTNDTLRESVHKYATEFAPELSEEQLLEAIEAGNTSSTEAKVWWTLDPIDGTLGFLRRGQYAVALALMVDNKPVLGVLGCPALPYTTPAGEEKIGCVLVAVRGQGAFIRALDCDGEAVEGAVEVPIAVSPNSNPVNAVFTESHAHTSPLNQKITELLQVKAEPVRIDSQCK
jgi:3'-phosphoadenosine 5'-phosphosulfate (PAPS) 3'-phosphatase